MINRLRILGGATATALHFYTALHFLFLHGLHFSMLEPNSTHEIGGDPLMDNSEPAISRPIDSPIVGSIFRRRHRLQWRTRRRVARRHRRRSPRRRRLVSTWRRHGRLVSTRRRPVSTRRRHGRCHGRCLWICRPLPIGPSPSGVGTSRRHGAARRHGPNLFSSHGSTGSFNPSGTGPDPCPSGIPECHLHAPFCR